MVSRPYAYAITWTPRAQLHWWPYLPAAHALTYIDIPPECRLKYLRPRPKSHA